MQRSREQLVDYKRRLIASADEQIETIDAHLEQLAHALDVLRAR